MKTLKTEDLALAIGFGFESRMKSENKKRGRIHGVVRERQGTACATPLNPEHRV
jgi:hypothetical protein